ARGPPATPAIDPLAELGPICQRFGVWLHVDAAYAGISAVAPELRELQAGVEGGGHYTDPPPPGRCRSSPSTCATRRPTPARWSTTATGRSSSAGASAR